MTPKFVAGQHLTVSQAKWLNEQVQKSRSYANKTNDLKFTRIWALLGNYVDADHPEYGRQWTQYFRDRVGEFITNDTAMTNVTAGNAFPIDNEIPSDETAIFAELIFGGVADYSAGLAPKWLYKELQDITIPDAAYNVAGKINTSDQFFGLGVKTFENSIQLATDDVHSEIATWGATKIKGQIDGPTWLSVFRIGVGFTNGTNTEPPEEPNQDNSTVTLYAGNLKLGGLHGSDPIKDHITISPGYNLAAFNGMFGRIGNTDLRIGLPPTLTDERTLLIENKANVNSFASTIDIHSTVDSIYSYGARLRLHSGNEPSINSTTGWAITSNWCWFRAGSYTVTDLDFGHYVGPFGNNSERNAELNAWCTIGNWDTQVADQYSSFYGLRAGSFPAGRYITSAPGDPVVDLYSTATSAVILKQAFSSSGGPGSGQPFVFDFGSTGDIYFFQSTPSFKVFEGTGYTGTISGLTFFRGWLTGGSFSGGTVTDVDTGTGLTGGLITGSGTISLDSASIASLNLADSALQPADIGSTVQGYSATLAGLDSGLTASPTELNILDGVTASTAELNLLDGATYVGMEIGEQIAGASVNGGLAFQSSGSLAQSTGIVFNDTDDQLTLGVSNSGDGIARFNQTDAPNTDLFPIGMTYGLYGVSF